MYQDIKERTFNFALRVIDFSIMLPRTQAGKVLGGQVLRSGTSVGANVEEGVAAYSKDEYIYKMNIALKEAREAHYWLRLIGRSNMLGCKSVNDLIVEADEIKKILGAIVSKLRGKSK